MKSPPICTPPSVESVGLLVAVRQLVQYFSELDGTHPESLAQSGWERQDRIQHLLKEFWIGTLTTNGARRSARTDLGRIVKLELHLLDDVVLVEEPQEQQVALLPSLYGRAVTLGEERLFGELQRGHVDDPLHTVHLNG